MVLCCGLQLSAPSWTLGSVTPLCGQRIPSSVPLAPYALPPVPQGLAACSDHLLTATHKCSGTETRLGPSAFSFFHFALNVLSPSCTSGPNMTATLVQVFHPCSSSQAPRGPHLPACQPASLPQCSPRAASGRPRLLPVLGAAGSAQAQSGFGRASAAPCSLCFGQDRYPIRYELLHFSSLE